MSGVAFLAFAYSLIMDVVTAASGIVCCQARVIIGRVGSVEREGEKIFMVVVMEAEFGQQKAGQNDRKGILRNRL